MWFYSFYLGVYFVLIIRYQWPDRKISQYFEIPAFVVAIGVSWTGAIWGVVTKSFNPRPNDLLCLSQGYPFQCEIHDDMECIRGGQDTNAGTIVASVSLGCAIGGIVTTILVYHSVWRVVRKHRDSHSFSSLDGMEKRLQSVAKQCFLYFLVYVNVLAWPLGTNLIYGITRKEGDEGLEPPRNEFLPYSYSLISWFFFPITGLFNCMVYLRPRYVAWRSSQSQKGFVWAVTKAIGSDPLPQEHLQRSARAILAEQNVYLDNGFRGVSKALKLYESRDFDPSLEQEEEFELEEAVNEQSLRSRTSNRDRGRQNDDIYPQQEESEEIIFEYGADEDEITSDTLSVELTTPCRATKTDMERAFDSIIK